MGKSSPKAPAAPNPTTTANAQTKSNEQTALYQAGLNNVNQVTPYGNLTYSLGGSSTNPQYTSTISLSPQEQTIFNQQLTNQTQAGTAANAALGQYQSAAANPIDYSSFNPIPTSSDLQGQQTAAMAAQNTLLAPQLAQQQQALESQLANQGLSPGTQAYANAYNNFNNLQAQTLANETLNSSQYASTQNQIALANRNQQISEAEAQRNDPLNQYQALMGGSQVTNPSFSLPQNNQVDPANIANIVEQQYQSQLAGYNAQNASNTSLNSSIFGLGGSFLGSKTTGGGSVAGSIFNGLTSWL